MSKQAINRTYGKDLKGPVHLTQMHLIFSTNRSIWKLGSCLHQYIMRSTNSVLRACAVKPDV